MHTYKFTLALLLALATVPAMAQVNAQGKNHEVPTPASQSLAEQSQVSAKTQGNTSAGATSHHIQEKVERIIAQHEVTQQQEQQASCKACCTQSNAEQDPLSESELLEAEIQLQHIRDTQDPQASFQTYPELLQRKPAKCSCPCHKPEQAQLKETPSKATNPAMPNDSLHVHGPAWQRKVGI